MKLTLSLALIAASLASLATLNAADAPVASAKPNVVFLMGDDVGWSDISLHPGGFIRTPSIDHLFKESVELRNYMGWCVCSPTRAMLLTARHPFRVGTGPETGGELAQDEVTIAEGFKANGYRTGIFGKWHNGENPNTSEYRAAFSAAYPTRNLKDSKGGLGVNAHGFDEAWVYYGGGGDYFTRRNLQNQGPVSWWHNLEYRPVDKGYTEDLILQHALDFIRDNKDRPFFCYVPFHIVHTPLEAKNSDLALADNDMDVNIKATEKTKRIYKAMMEAEDRNVASILKELDDLGLRDNTIVVYTSDNGATQDGSNLPFRGGKHTIFEGGTHLFATVRWPKAGLVGGKKWDGFCGALDMFPTLMDMAGLKMPQTKPLDGKDVWPALRDNTPSPVESYYWAWRDADAIRTPDWKLIRYADHSELFDIHKDVAEAHNVAAAHSDVVKDLTAKMNGWVTSIGAAITHLPAPKKLDTKVAPAGDVLEITATVTDKASANDRLIVPFASYEEPVYATDYIEYDVMVAPGGLNHGFYYSPYKHAGNAKAKLDFSRGEGFDQFGQEQALGPEPKGGPGVWEHRVIGLTALAPSAFGKQALVFRANHPGTFKVYLDNLQILHVDGTTTPIWLGEKDTRATKIEAAKSFTNVHVRTVPLASVK
jgi:arylsulfatase A-like enzyme